MLIRKQFGFAIQYVEDCVHVVCMLMNDIHTWLVKKEINMHSDEMISKKVSSINSRDLMVVKEEMVVVEVPLKCLSYS